MGASLAEIIVLAAVVWLIARALEPLRRRLERLILRFLDRKSTRLNSSHIQKSRMPSSA